MLHVLANYVDLSGLFYAKIAVLNNVWIRVNLRTFLSIIIQLLKSCIISNTCN